MRYLDIDTAKKISKVGLGTYQFGSAEWGYGERYAGKEANAIVRRALELGVTLFDTAEIYGSGRSEEILGQALGKHRELVFLATKIFPVVPSAFVVKQRAAASARRIGTSRLELYQVHFPNPLVSDRTLMRGMRSLQRAGAIGEVGVSNYSLARWRAAEEALGSRVLSNQVQYSLVQRSPERELLPFAESHDRIVIAFSPLAMGLLSGKYHGTTPPVNPIRASNPLFRPENLPATSQLIEILREVADAHSASPAQIALAWVIHSPAVVAIPGASSVEQLESNVAAAQIRLADDEYSALRQSSARLFAAPGLQPFANADARESGRSAKLVLERSVRRGRYVAKITWRNYRPYRRRRSMPEGMQGRG
jgi:aryl-alcohol dehydrogenase-like predicted oxidoreductase